MADAVDQYFSNLSQAPVSMAPQGDAVDKYFAGQKAQPTPSAPQGDAVDKYWSALKGGVSDYVSSFPQALSAGTSAVAAGVPAMAKAAIQPVRAAAGSLAHKMAQGMGPEYGSDEDVAAEPAVKGFNKLGTQLETPITGAATGWQGAAAQAPLGLATMATSPLVTAATQVGAGGQPTVGNVANAGLTATLGSGVINPFLAAAEKQLPFASNAINAGIGGATTVGINALSGQPLTEGLGVNTALGALGGHEGEAHEAPVTEAPSAKPAEPPIPDVAKRIEELHQQVQDLRDTLSGKGTPAAEAPIPPHSETYNTVKDTAQMQEVQAKLDELRNAVSPHEAPNALQEAHDRLTPQQKAEVRTDELLKQEPQFQSTPATEGSTSPGEFGTRNHQMEKSNATVVQGSNSAAEDQENPHGTPATKVPELLAPGRTEAGDNVQTARQGTDAGVSSGTKETENPLLAARRRAGVATLPTAEEVKSGLKTVAQKTEAALHAPSIRDIGSWLGADTGLDKTGRRVANDLRGMFGRQDLARARLEEQAKPTIDAGEKLPQEEQARILSHMEQNAGQSPDPQFAGYAEQRQARNVENHQRMLDLQKRDMLGVSSNVYDLNRDWVGRSFEFPDESGRFPGDRGYDSQSATRSLAGKEDALRRRKFDTLEQSMEAVKDLGGRPKHDNLFKMALDKDISVSNSLTARETLADLRDKGDVRVADLDNPIKPSEGEITDRTGRMADRRFSAPYAVAKDLHDPTIPLQKRITKFRERRASGDIVPLNPSTPRPLREAPGEENLEATGSGEFSNTLPKGHIMIDEAVSRAADPRKLVANKNIAGLLNNVSDVGTESSLVGNLIKANQFATKLKLAVNARHYITETASSSGAFYGQAIKDLLRGSPVRAFREAIEGVPGINTAAAIFRNKSIRDSILHGETGEAMASGGGMSGMTKSSTMFKRPEFESMREAMHKGDLTGTAQHFLNGTLGKLNTSLFDHFIPMMRRHVMAMKAQSELAAHPGQLGTDDFNDLMSKHAKDVSNLMGVEDDRIHFQNKIASTVGHTLFGVPNWTLGKLRATGGAALGSIPNLLKGKNMDPATYSMLGGIAVMAGMGTATYMLMNNGRTPQSWNDIRRPGGWEIPSPWELISDAVAGHTGVADAIRNRLSPVVQFATDMAEGHNGMGEKTRDTWTHIGKSMKDDFAPMSFEGLGKASTPGGIAAAAAGLSHSKVPSPKPYFSLEKNGHRYPNAK